MWVPSSAGTLCFNNCRLIGSLKSFIRSAGFNRSQLIGSAEQAHFDNKRSKNLISAFNFHFHFLSDFPAQTSIANHQSVKEHITTMTSFVDPKTVLGNVKSSTWKYFKFRVVGDDIDRSFDLTLLFCIC